MLKDRCVITLLIAGLALGLRAWANGVSYAGMPPASFWKAKLANPGTADLVVAGDSRVYRGVSSQELAMVTGGGVANFGFSGAGLDGEFLDAAHGMLSAGGRKILVLGITPFSLTPNAAARNGFKSNAKHYGKSLNAFQIWLDRIEARLPATEFRELRTGTARLRKGGTVKTEYHPEGWAEYRPTVIDEKKTKVTIEHATKQYRENVVSQEALDELFARVREWTKHGVTVAGFRPPVTPGMKELENTSSGFDEAEFRRRFEAAGGHWLEINADGLVVYDGSHLTGESAVKFTQRLGEALSRLK